MAIAPFIVTKTLKQVSNFKYNSVKEALYEGVELEEKLSWEILMKNGCGNAVD